jgi:hypothetical protein
MREPARVGERRLGLVRLMQHGIRANKARPFVDAAPVAGEPRREPAHHALGHRLLRLGNGGLFRRRGLALERGQARVHDAPPGRIGRRIGEQRLVLSGRVRLLAVLLRRERAIKAGLRLGRLFGKRPIELLAGLVGDHAPRGGDQGVAVSRAPQRVFAEKTQRLRIGMRRVGIALEAQVDRCDHRPALAVVRLGNEPLLDPRDRRLDLAGAMRLNLPARQRLVGHSGLAEARIKGKGDRRQADCDQRGRNNVSAPSRRRPLRGARSCGDELRRGRSPPLPAAGDRVRGRA